MRLAADLYRYADTLPKSELFGLAGQIRRSAVSIPSNIAEGAGRRTTKEFLSFLYIARGSWAELDTQLLLASDLGYLNADDLGQLRSGMDEVGRLLNSVITALRRRLNGGSC
jgi:four helix bundle protein